MKTRYEIRYWVNDKAYSRSLSARLRTRKVATRLVKFLKTRRGIDAFSVPIKINVGG